MSDFLSLQCSYFKVSELAQWKKYTVSIKSCYNLKNLSMFCLMSRRVRELLFLFLTCKKKKTSSNIENLRQHFSAIIYRLPISLQEIEISRLSVSPRAFLKSSIMVIALVQKGLSCPSLSISTSSYVKQHATVQGSYCVIAAAIG